jgi:putative glutamine amidotransferase
MRARGHRPLVGVISDRRRVGKHAFHMAGESYLRAAIEVADVYPVVLPVLAGDFDVLDVLDRLDGLYLTGSPSNVEPRHYGGEPPEPGTWLDPQRDAAALALIPAALRIGIPLLAICRGFQELNVACGGTLHQKVHEVPGYRVHKENPDDPVDVQYADAHAVRFTSGSLLERLTGETGAIVNSVHSQGIDRLGDGLTVEAEAEDGLVEAFRVTGAPGFNLAVQWHPEWSAAEKPVSRAIFRAWGNACRAWRLREWRR